MHAYGAQSPTFGHQLSPSSLCVLGIELWSSGWLDRGPLLAGPSPWPFFSPLRQADIGLELLMLTFPSPTVRFMDMYHYVWVEWVLLIVPHLP